MMLLTQQVWYKETEYMPVNTSLKFLCVQMILSYINSISDDTEKVRM